MRRSGVKAIFWTVGATIAAAAVLAANANGERAQSGNLIASLSSDMRPHFLPRTRAVPVSLSVSSDFSTADRSPLPELRRISLAVGGRGRLGYRGLPVCPEARIRARTQRRALAECRSALVGSGHMNGRIHIEGQPPFAFRGQMLMFNGRLADGRPVALADVHSSSPPVSFVMPFVSHPGSGAVGMELTARLPRTAGGFVRVSHFDLILQRRFRYGGETRGYLNASCAVPAGFTAAVFPVVQATYDFAGGRSVTVAASRGCSVRQ